MTGPGARSPDPGAHFQTGGETYAAYRPTYPAELPQALAALCEARALAVDVGCGSGQLSVPLADHFDRVVGVDVSAAQLSAATRHPQVDYRVGSSDRLPVDDGAASLIVAAQAAHWFDLDAFYAEVRRAAAPGGIVALVTYGPVEVAGPLSDRFSRFYRTEIASFWPPERRHVETGYRDLPFPFPPLDLPQLAIEAVWPHRHLWGYVESWSAARAPGAPEVIARARADAEAILPPDAAVTVRFPLSVRAGRVARAAR